MAINRLSVVNDMLALLGELPLNDLDAFHPVVPRALSTLDSVNETIQAGSWWFNTEYPTLVPQAVTKEIVLSADILSCDSLAAAPRVTKRGARLYNLDASTYQFDKDVAATIQRLIPFDDLSSTPRAFIAAASILKFNTTIDGDSAKTASIANEYQRAYITFNAEHIRHQQCNMLTRPSVQRVLNRMVGTKQNMRR